MINTLRIVEHAGQRTNLKMYTPTQEVENTAQWMINGFPATILVWTAEEWARLRDRPLDARRSPNGVWCALRMI